MWESGAYSERVLEKNVCLAMFIEPEQTSNWLTIGLKKKEPLVFNIGDDT